MEVATASPSIHRVGMASRKRVFRAVFPSPSEASIPTPSSTPQLGSATFAGSSLSLPDVNPAQDVASEKIRWERSWHSATAFLSLPHHPIPVGNIIRNRTSSLGGEWLKALTPDVSFSISYLVSEQSEGHRLRRNKKEDDLLEWYAQEVGRHYTRFQLPLLIKGLGTGEDADKLLELVQVLQVLRAVYFAQLQGHVVRHIEERKVYELTKFEERYDAMVAESLSQSSFAGRLRTFLKLRGQIVLRLPVVDAVDKDAMEDTAEANWAKARRETHNLMSSINDVGLGGAHAQRIFAEVMSELLTAYINATYAGQWVSPSTVPDELKDWVENSFARFAVEVLAYLGSKEESTSVDRSVQVSAADLENWKQRAVCDLGALRIKELFEIVVDWDNGSRGAIEDLKQYTTTIAARSHLTNSFSSVLSQRLLQPGASTTEILQVYVCIIRAFAVLDPRGVLLDRLARPIRRYLRDRDDTAKIIVGGLLADETDDPGNTDALIELAAELNKASNIASGDDDDGEMDWDDMNWVPDPIDAGPEYKKSKNHDVIGTLVSLFDTKDVFVKEFQNILGERLLQPDLSFDKETRVLELLKIRFGDPPLQACEVMLKDILDSTRTDSLIHKKENLPSTAASAPTIHSKILSRLFWPTLNETTFSVPPAIAALQARYATAFEAIKPARKLTWLQALGTVTVELHLGDRTVVEDILPWQASVIHAFHDTHPSPAPPVAKSVPDLAASLAMDPSLVLLALTFWARKLVLRETSPGVYSVLETLAGRDRDASDAEQASLAAAQTSAASAAAAAARSAEELAAEKMEEFWPYIVGMLTNQGAMNARRIVTMLKFAVPGGFAYGPEELKDFLRGKVEGRALEMQGASYKVVK
ncbi:hypothetical protein MMC26_001173 [Xylographa opegraphella]|nr:hypothetical protein [Xylographa opegraphella]